MQSFFKKLRYQLASQTLKPRRIKKLGLFFYITLLFALAVNLFYGDLFELWETQLPGIGADGAKNYYTLAYHIIHDSSSWWFDGMNYPTGEHLMFTDNQPLIANTLRWLDGLLPIAENLHWLLPIFTFVSFWIAALIIGNLITKTGIHHALTAIISVGIVLLSPQLIRLSGHYSLSYAFVIPLVFALCYQLFLNRSWKTASILMLSLFLSGFIHPYLLAMASLFVLLFFLTRTLASSNRNNWMEWMKAFAISLGPLILFQVVLKITDPVEDRPEAPYGFLIYRATLSSLFMPTELWYMNPIKAVSPFLFKRAAEGGFYLGLFSIAGTIWGLISLFKDGISNVAEYSTLRKFTLITLLASIPIALLSVGIPFVFGPLEKLLEFAGPLKQFRGIGRFSFVLYYAMNLYAAVELAHFFVQDTTRRKMSIITLFVGVLWYEAYSYKTHIIDFTSHGTEWLNGTQWTAANLKKEDFQAIIPVPFYHTGSENFRTDDQQENLAPSFGLSQESGIPLMSVQMSRTSLSETLKSIQLSKQLLVEPSILTDVEDERPFLIFVDQAITLEGFQMQLVYHSTPLFKKDHWELRSLPANAFEKILAENRSKAKHWSKDALVIEGDSSLQNHILFYQSYNHIDNERTFDGDGAITAERTDWTDIVPSKFILKDSTVYELSFWFYAGDQNAVNTQVWRWDFVNGEEAGFHLSEVGDHTRAVIDKWILVVIPVEPIASNQSLRIALHRDGKKMPITLDEVLVKPALLHTTKKGSLNVNNRYFESVSSASETK